MALMKQFRNYKFRTVKELIICGATEVANGKERKYVWNSVDPDIIAIRESMLDTFCAIHDAEDDSQQIRVGNDYFDVSQYEIPKEVWLAKILNYTRRVSLSNRAFAKKKKIYAKSLANVYNADNVLSPTGLKEAYEIFAEYNRFKDTEGVSKQLRNITEYEAVFTNSDDYFEIINEEGITYDQHFVNLLKIKIDKLAGFGEIVEPSTKEVSVKEIVGVKTNGQVNTEGDNSSKQ